jgi:diguanylate cyclase
MMGDETNTRTSSATASEHDFERTITIGERAIGYLREFRTPAIPRNYELFYIHSAGYNKELSQAIRNAIAAHSRLTEEDAEAIYQTYLQPKEYSEEVEAVGGKVSSEIKEILGWIASASQQTGVYSDSLKGITDELPRVQNQAQLKDVVQKLVLSTNEMADYNHDLEKRLAESKRQIEELHVSLETIRTESLTDQLTGLSTGSGSTRFSRWKWPRRREAAIRFASCCSTSTTSRPSTIPLATRPATRCCASSLTP